MKKIIALSVTMAVAVCGCTCQKSCADKIPDKIIFWEAHRAGGGVEMPESTPAGFEYTWMLGGVPEADVNTTKDNVIMSLHDGTLKRTGRNIPPEIADKHISKMTYAEVKKYDIGNDEYPNQTVPALFELFEKLADDPKKEIIIDYKNVPLQVLSDMIDKYDIAEQVIFTTTNEDIAAEFKKLQPDVRVKIWIGGKRDRIMERFRKLAAKNFEGVEQVELHFNRIKNYETAEWAYDITPDDVREALETTKKHGVLLKAGTFWFNKKSLFAVLDLGVRAFAIDHPNMFCKMCSEYFAKKWNK